MTKRTSTNYVCTLDPKSTNDMEKLQSIRQTIKVLNQTSAEKHRVCVRGRKPIKKATAYSWIRGYSKNKVGYDFGGNVIGGLKNASMYDIYIYKA